MKEKSTDELLALATPRPWETHGNIGRKGDPGILADAAPCIIATMGNAKEWPIEAKHNAELIARAVNSFEAMREVLEALTGHPAWLDIAEQEASFSDGVTQTYGSRIDQALALAEGKEVQP